MSIVLRSQIVEPNKFLWTVLESAKGYVPTSPCVALDPGETTGVCFWDPTKRRFTLEQWDTKDLGQAYDHLCMAVDILGLRSIRYEDYKVYEHKAKDHVNNSLHTAQLIGAIRIAAHVNGLPVDCKMAAAAKTFWTDTKLEMTGTYTKGMRHGRDAMRHMLTLMAFPPK